MERLRERDVFGKLVMRMPGWRAEDELESRLGVSAINMLQEERA
jgi:hypothetical protein